MVAEPEGIPGCVLIRALKPLTGVELMRERRPGIADASLANGPGKLTRALAITRADNGRDLTQGALTIQAFQHPQNFEIQTTRRIGITKCADLPLRFLLR